MAKGVIPLNGQVVDAPARDFYGLRGVGILFTSAFTMFAGDLNQLQFQWAVSVIGVFFCTDCV